MKAFVIHIVRNLPHLKWGIFQHPKMEGMFCPCCKDIILDVINEQSFLSRFHVIIHELSHYFFHFCPEKLYHLFNFCIDITDGGRPELIYGIDEVDECTVMLHVFD
jgi:hypothetical protein